MNDKWEISNELLNNLMLIINVALYINDINVLHHKEA